MRVAVPMSQIFPAADSLETCLGKERDSQAVGFSVFYAMAFLPTAVGVFPQHAQSLSVLTPASEHQFPRFRTHGTQHFPCATIHILSQMAGIINECV